MGLRAGNCQAGADGLGLPGWDLPGCDLRVGPSGWGLGLGPVGWDLPGWTCRLEPAGLGLQAGTPGWTCRLGGGLGLAVGFALHRAYLDSRRLPGLGLMRFFFIIQVVWCK